MSYGELRSPQWHAHRAKHAQDFLDHFVRKVSVLGVVRRIREANDCDENTAEIDEIQTTETLKPVMLPWMERALFMELQQQLDTQDVRLSRGSSKMNDSDRVKRMKNILQDSNSPEEALLKACFSPIGQSTTHGCQNFFDSIISLREAEYQLVRDELKKNLRHAEWLDRQLKLLLSDRAKVSHSHVLRRDLMQNCDPEGSLDFNELFKEAQRGYRFEHEEEFYRDKPSKEVLAEQAEMKRRAKREAKEVKEKAKKATKIAKAPTTKLGRAVLVSKGSTKESDPTRNLGLDAQDSDETIDANEPSSKPSADNDEEIASPLEPVEPLDPRPWKINLQDRNAINFMVKNIMNDIWKLRAELLSRKRALRFLNTAQEFYVWQCKMGPRPNCLSCGKAAEDPSYIFVLGLCGHVVCKKCLEDRRESGGCVVHGCSSAAGRQHIHPADSFGSTNQLGNSRSAKIDNIILTIKEVAKHEQILLFVQFPRILKVICSALEASGISYYAIGSGATRGAVAMVRDFQENESEEKKQVLILNPSDETAAGL